MTASGVKLLLEEAARQLACARRERRLFGIEAGPWDRLEAELGAARGQVAKAAGLRLPPWAGLAQAKRRAAAVEETCRRAVREALENPNVVSELKLRALCRRYSDAAEALQKAADSLAGERLP